MDEIDYRINEICEVLGNGIRFWIVKLLHEQAMSVSGLAEEIDRPVQTVSSHLKKLRDRDLVKAESDGRRWSYELKRPEIVEHCLKLRSFISREDLD